MCLCDRAPLTTTFRAVAARLPLLAMLVALQAAATGPASAFSSVVFFGDSLTDTGNTCASAMGEGWGYAAGRCSNGPVWADYLIADLGFGSEATSSASGGSNYATGGARSRDLASQIEAYLSAGSGAADPDALHVIWLGGNDILFEVILGSSGPGAMQAAAEAIGAGIESLAAAGATQFAVANAPDVGLVFGNPLLNPPLATTSTPFGEADRTILSELSLEFNSALAEVLANVSVASVIAVDVSGTFEAIIGDPEAFRFSPDAVDASSQSRPFPIACLADPICAADPQGAVADGFLIFDSVHPTTALHRLIADDALAVAVPEPSTGFYVAIGLALLARRRRRVGDVRSA